MIRFHVCDYCGKEAGDDVLKIVLYKFGEEEIVYIHKNLENCEAINGKS